MKKQSATPRAVAHMVNALITTLFILTPLIVLTAATSRAEDVTSDMDRALATLAATPAESEAEAQAMSAIIALVHGRSVPPVPPPDAATHAIRADNLAQNAKKPKDYSTVARELDRAARAAPWVAEYHFAWGKELAKAQAYAAAARAFGLYLEAAPPSAPDRADVIKLIAGLRGQSGHPDGSSQSLVLPSSPPARHRGEIFRDCPNCPEMVVLPGGRFVMGSPADEQGRFDSEGPQHAVSVEAFALGKYEVTEEEFITFLTDTNYQPQPCNRILDKTWRSLDNGIVFPPGMADLPRQPAVCVNWTDAQAYVAWVNRRFPDADGSYRLPSEAEWEYAARAGTSVAHWWGSALGSGNANCHGCGSAWDNTLIAPVGSFGPNGFGLYDMLGNVWQWVADCWNENYTGAPGDGAAWTSGDCAKHVMRGGSWSNLPVFVRSAARNRGDVAGSDFDYSSYVGFRLAKTLP